MPYRFATENVDYSDYASGRLFYAAPGHPALPVRLVSELFQRCQAIRRKAGMADPVTIYDPCCGTAYHLAALAYLHWPEIETIVGSDINPEIVSIAEKNLSLLTLAGLEKRAAAIDDLFEQYGKQSHAEAAKSVNKFRGELKQNLEIREIETKLFVADATNATDVVNGLGSPQIDVVIADVPYGNKSEWQTAVSETTSADTMLNQMLDSLLNVLHDHSVVAIVADKGQKANHPTYKKSGRFRIGKRQMMLLQPA